MTTGLPSGRQAQLLHRLAEERKKERERWETLVQGALSSVEAPLDVIAERLRCMNSLGRVESALSRLVRRKVAAARIVQTYGGVARKRRVYWLLEEGTPQA